MPVDLAKEMKALTARVARIETRLVQLMLHLKLDPYSKKYDDRGTPIKPRKDTS